MPTLLLPVGRNVYGHPSHKIHKKDNKKQPMFKQDGSPVMVHSFGVAYAKDVFSTQIWPVMYAAASAAYGGQQPPPHFAYKYKDGDGVDRQGKSYASREGYAGHIVVHFETQFDLLAYRQNAAGGWDQITENDYKTGDYIAVNASIEGNKPTDPTHTPGLFINPQGVLLIGHGQAIINAPSADQMFAGQTFQLPPGATAPGTAPTMPPGMPTPPGLPPGAMPPAPVAPAAQQYQPQPVQPSPVAGPSGYPVPAGVGYVPQPQAPTAPQYQPQAPTAPGQPVYPPAYDLVAAATGQPVPPAYAPQAPVAPQYQPQPAPGAPPAYPLPPGVQPPR